MNHKEKYLVLAIVAVIVVSGCAQASIVIDSLNKLKNLVSTTGYSASYDINFKIDLGQLDAQSASAFGNMQQKPIKFSEQTSEKGEKVKTVIDLSGLSQLGLPGDFSSFSVYQTGSEAFYCAELKSVAECSKGDLNGLGYSASSLAQLQQINQLSKETPEQSLSKLKKLYDKGALTLGPVTKETIIGRQCDKVSFTVSDTGKLDPTDFASLLGGGNKQIPPEQLSQLAPVLQKMIKSMSEEICFDSQYGLPLKSSATIALDLTEFIKGFAASLGQADQQAETPQIKYTIIIDEVATSFKPSVSDSEFNLPSGAKIDEQDFTNSTPSAGPNGPEASDVPLQGV